MLKLNDIRYLDWRIKDAINSHNECDIDNPITIIKYLCKNNTMAYLKDKYENYNFIDPRKQAILILAYSFTFEEAFKFCFYYAELVNKEYIAKYKNEKRLEMAIWLISKWDKYLFTTEDKHYFYLKLIDYARLHVDGAATINKVKTKYWYLGKCILYFLNFIKYKNGNEFVYWFIDSYIEGMNYNNSEYINICDYGITIMDNK